jgi:phosphoenolpyruvate carboxylase
VPLTVDFRDTVMNAVSYEWNFGDGSPTVPTSSPNISHTYNSIGTYRVMLVAIDSTTCNLRDTSYLNIRVGDIKAQLDFNPVKLNPCDAFQYRFDNLSTTPPVRPFLNTSFEWDFGDGSPRVTAGAGSVTHRYLSPGTYNVKLFLVDTSYCNSPDSLVKQLRVAALVKAEFETPPTGCAPYTAEFNNISQGGQQFNWDFGDGTLDIRQESSVHNKVLEEVAEKQDILPDDYAGRSEEEKIELLINIQGKADVELYEGLAKDTLESFQVIKTIQQFNGEQGSNRYIISQCNSALNVMEVYGLFLMNGWEKESLNIDIVPLFETIDDLKEAPAIMKCLYANETYYKHLLRRKKNQTIMVGFSDGTKDGGYLMANWSIYKAKEELTRVSREYGIDVIFFDGRGGPPARGGGKTHKFYASMGSNISTKEIHLTIQGQTVSSSFGNIDAAQFNIEQLLNAGITNELFRENEKLLDPQQEEAIKELASISYDVYNKLKNHPVFLDYLSQVSPLNYYSETNISSRPSKRGKSVRLALKDLRAIPFVGAWSQLKQNVPGYYGLGTALQTLEKNGRLGQIKHLYTRSQYFKTLLDNCEMAMKKSFFPLTAYLSKHPEYSEIWNMIYEEYELTQKYLFKLSGKNEIMSDYPVDQMSIQMREKIVLPLTTIQQYALTQLREETRPDPEKRAMLERLIIRTSFGIINAGRNSV